MPPEAGGYGRSATEFGKLTLRQIKILTKSESQIKHEGVADAGRAREFLKTRRPNWVKKSDLTQEQREAMSGRGKTS